EGQYGDSPLHFAAASCRPEIVELLLRKGAKVNAENDGSLLPIHSAVEGGNRDVVRLLIGARAKLDRKYPWAWAGSLVHRAAREGAHAVVHQLLAAGLGPEGADGEGWTPLQWAVRNDDLATARVLLQYGADVNQAIEGDPPLRMAAARDRTNMIALL